jgi:hypothetical protein
MKTKERLRHRPKMKKWIVLAAIVGSIVPIVWLVMAFAYFAVPQSGSTDLFWTIVHITCPFWDMAVDLTTTLLMLVLNAGFYALVIFGLGKLRAVSRRPSGDD